MKRMSKILLVLILSIFLTGCRRNEQSINSDNYKIILKTYNKYNFNYDSVNFRTAREEVLIEGENFRIGIENPIKIKNEKAFKKYQKDYTKKDNYKEVKYSGYKGFMIYTPSYIRYEIYLNIDNKYIMRLNIYSLDHDKKHQTKALNSDDVQDILKHMDVAVKN